MNKIPSMFERVSRTSTPTHHPDPRGTIERGRMAVVCVILFLSLLLVPLDGAPVMTYLRGQDITQDNLTDVITTITTLHDSISCSVQCKKSAQCGGFSVNETGCFLYTAGVTYTDEAIVPVGYYPA
ncbi:hypothetical protein FHG87_021328 [Trinorchestia longiramus]|nr:hypothetical protein FHG87_021328 [Trinorchestia longiramus]